MTRGAKPIADVSIDPALVRALLREQHADLAHLPFVEVGEGWDNKMFRLGEELAIRLPRRAASAALIEHEQRWLLRLAPRLPLPVPVPLRLGLPGCGFPLSWSVVPWLAGQSVMLAPPPDGETAAVALGQFLRALHQPAAADAPHNPWRGVPLAARANTLRQHLQQVDGLVDRVAILALWERAVSTPAWSGPPLWIHGNLHPGNLLVSGGRLAAVIDFGDLAAGDPATDLSVVWMLLTPSARQTFLKSAGGEFYPLDEHMLMRARGWALALGLVYLANSWDDELMGALGRATIDAALKDSA